MKFLDILIILLLFGILGLGLYVLLLNFPAEGVIYEDYKFETSDLVVGSDAQFYPNMRYRDRVISYNISKSCSLSQKLAAEKAFSIISDKTILKFNNFNDNENPEIEVLCSELAPEPEEERHFVAGEGGPSEIINVSSYSVIFSGKISLYRENNCNNPNVALHEILHALGFDHNNNQKSIMYPLTKCDQEIDDYIIEEINNLYEPNSSPDLVIDRISANRSGRYLSFKASISNLGFKDSDDARLVLYVEDEFIKDFNLEEIGIGTRKILNVENLRIPKKSEIISFVVESFEGELNENNNRVDIGLIVER